MSEKQDFAKVYAGRRAATLEDARHESDAVIKAIQRISKSVDAKASVANRDLAAGKLYEIANELASAEVAYRRSLAADPNLHEAAARLSVILSKQHRYEEAIQIGHDLFLKEPTAIFKSLVYQGPLSLCTVLGDAYRLSGNYTVAAGFYREAAMLENNTPYSVSQAVLTMALSGEGNKIAEFASKHAAAGISERISSIVRLSQETDHRQAMIKQVASTANLKMAEAMY
jgi:tetratricopeptide (TPR) repeat protein